MGIEPHPSADDVVERTRALEDNQRADLTVRQIGGNADERRHDAVAQLCRPDPKKAHCPAQRSRPRRSSGWKINGVATRHRMSAVRSIQVNVGSLNSAETATAIKATMSTPRATRPPENV